MPTLGEPIVYGDPNGSGAIYVLGLHDPKLANEAAASFHTQMGETTTFNHRQHPVAWVAVRDHVDGDGNWLEPVARKDSRVEPLFVFEAAINP